MLVANALLLFIEWYMLLGFETPPKPTSHNWVEDNMWEFRFSKGRTGEGWWVTKMFSGLGHLMTYSGMPDIKISNGQVIAIRRDNSQHIQVKQCRNKSGAEMNLNVRLYWIYANAGLGMLWKFTPLWVAVRATFQGLGSCLQAVS